jgi:LuxR family maltose regulon positive regulatory protein
VTGVLRTKLLVPPVPATVVPRPRLTARLDAAPVTAVTAGAGWGKTTLLAAWARRQPAGTLAWVSLDARDDDPSRFWTSVTTALAAVAPAATDAALRALAVPSVDPLDVAVPALLDGLTASPTGVLLVLDDLHELGDPRVTEGLEFLLDHLPPPLRVVLAGRTEPPVGLARLRARGRLAEVTAGDLRFTDDEARHLLAALVPTTPDPAACRDVQHRTEGWAAGLVLGGLALRDGALGAAVPPGPPGEQHAVDYLLAEVLRARTTEDRELLLCCAALDRVSGPLCDAVLGRTGSAAALDRLARAGVFLTAHADGVFGVHPLFRAALLRGEDDAARVTGLRLRAAEWLLQHGHPEQAVRARLAAGDQAGAAAALVASAGEFIDSGRVAVVAQLGDQLDRAATRSVPLLLSLAWAAGVTGRLPRVPALLDRAAELLHAADDDPGFPGFRTGAGALAALRSVYGASDDTGPEETLAAAAAAVAEESDPRLPGWVVARVALGGALLADERPAAALEVLDAAWSAPATAELPAFSRCEVAGLLSWCLVDAGEDDRAHRLLRATEPERAALETQLGDAAAAAVALATAARARLDQRDGDLSAARRQSARAARLVGVQAHPAVAVLVLVAAAEIALATGEPRAALALLDQAREVRRDSPAADAPGRRIEPLTARAGRQAAERAAAVLHEPLTDRELSVLRALRGPASRREIGAQLHLSVNTVKGYTAGLYRKLGVASRSEAVARGRELGLC